MSEETIWYRNGEQKVGPFAFSTIKELREKNAISDDTLVSDDDGTNWTAYSNFAEKSKSAETNKPKEQDANVPEVKAPSVTLPEEPSLSKNETPKVLLNPSLKINEKKDIKEEEIKEKEKKLSRVSHLIIGSLLFLVISFISASYRFDFHIHTLNLFHSGWDFEYSLQLSRMLGLGLFCWFIGLIGLIFSPGLFYLPIIMYGMITFSDFFNS